MRRLLIIINLLQLIHITQLMIGANSDHVLFQHNLLTPNFFSVKFMLVNALVLILRSLNIPQILVRQLEWLRLHLLLPTLLSLDLRLISLQLTGLLLYPELLN